VNAEQVARNDAVFRAANERIELAAARVQAAEPLPFICECADLTCRELVPLTRAEYEGVRRQPTWFLVAPGHEGGSDGAARIVERGNAYFVVEKLGSAADVAEALDPRTG
jgi:hypothetical protein